jgi:hypothetical protein
VAYDASSSVLRGFKSASKAAMKSMELYDDIRARRVVCMEGFAPSGGPLDNALLLDGK